jgi:hypothetical protein
LQVLLFFSAIRSPFKGNKSSIHTEAVKDGGGGYGVKDLSPIRGDEIGGQTHLRQLFDFSKIQIQSNQ